MSGKIVPRPVHEAVHPLDRDAYLLVACDQETGEGRHLAYEAQEEGDCQLRDGQRQDDLEEYLVGAGSVDGGVMGAYFRSLR